jgi:hypothetical protein
VPDTAPETAPTDTGQGLAPAPEVAAPQGVVPEGGAPEVQPTDPGVTAQPDGGQGLIAPYLEGVDEANRDAVADVLNRFRADQDAQVTGKFEDLNRFKQYVPEGQGPDYLDLPVALYENLLEAPLDTVQWIVSQFESRGVGLKEQIIAALQGEAPGDLAPVDPAPDDDRPLTRAEVAAEFQRLRDAEQAQTAEQQQAQERRQTAEGWFNEATEKFGLEVGAEDVAMRQAILTHAAQLLPQFRHLGETAGKQAIATAVEAFSNKYGSKVPAPAGDPATEPTLAVGGNPPAPSEPDLTDPKQRRAFMMAQLAGSQNISE